MWNVLSVHEELLFNSPRNCLSFTGKWLIIHWGLTSHSMRNDFVFLEKSFPILISHSMKNAWKGFPIPKIWNINFWKYFVDWGMTSYFLKNDSLRIWLFIPWALISHSLRIDLSFLDEWLILLGMLTIPWGVTLHSFEWRRIFHSLRNDNHSLRDGYSFAEKWHHIPWGMNNRSNKNWFSFNEKFRLIHCEMT